jgi:hypothetical protein
MNKPNPADIDAAKAALRRLMDCSERSDDAGEAARAVILMALGCGKLEMWQLHSLDQVDRDGAIELLRFVGDNPTFRQGADDEWGYGIRSWVKDFLALATRRPGRDVTAK